MVRSSLELYFDVLACVARADGRLAPEEQRFLRAAAESSRLSGDALARLERLLDVDTPFSVDLVLSEVAGEMNAAVVVEALRDAYVLAAADGEIAPVEIDVLDRLLARIGIAIERRPALHEWARRAAEHHIEGLALLAESWPAAQGVAPG
jgi:uncharacterized tellurite resistance protein B-like protein